MAKTNYLIDGLSGTGKSSIYEELTRRGYHAISSDRTCAYSAEPNTGRPGGPVHHDNWMWDKTKAIPVLESHDRDVLFVCGSCRNHDEFRLYFTKVFNLKIDDNTMRRRLTERTNNEFGKKPEEVELMLTLNREDDRPANSIDIDAARPLKDVVDDILAQCRIRRQL
jgi:gluconate kinase